MKGTADDFRMVTPDVIEEAHEMVECVRRSKELVDEIREQEPDFDQYLINRIDDHLAWIMDPHELSDKAKADVRDCMYKFALIGFIIGKRTYQITE